VERVVAEWMQPDLDPAMATNCNIQAPQKLVVARFGREPRAEAVNGTVYPGLFKATVSIAVDRGASQFEGLPLQIFLKRGNYRPPAALHELLVIHCNQTPRCLDAGLYDQDSSRVHSLSCLAKVGRRRAIGNAINLP
jgi:hypothetical protein